MKLLFDIREYSDFTKGYVTMRENCSYELDTNDLYELYHEAVKWAYPHMNSRQDIINVRLVDSCVPDADSYMEEDKLTDYVLEVVASSCDPDYQGEEGMMQAIEDYVDHYEQISWRNKILLVEL